MSWGSRRRLSHPCQGPKGAPAAEPAATTDLPGGPGERFHCANGDITVRQLAELIFFHKLDLEDEGRPDLAELARIWVDDRGFIGITYAARGTAGRALEVERATKRLRAPFKAFPQELGEALYEETRWRSLC